MTGHEHGRGVTSVAFLYGGELPLVQVIYDPEGDKAEGAGVISWFGLVFSDAPPPAEVDWDKVEPVCLHCVIADYGADVGVPLDLAVKHQCTVICDPETGWEPFPDYFDDDPAE